MKVIKFINFFAETRQWGGGGVTHVFEERPDVQKVVLQGVGCLVELYLHYLEDPAV